MGLSVKESGVPRSEIFLCTKIMSPAGSPEKTYEKCRESVRKIVGELSEGPAKKEDEYVDLFLIHTPNGGAASRKEMWLALEKLREEGLARSIGVSNFGAGQIAELKQYAKFWPPQVNQIEVCSLPSNGSETSTNCIDSFIPGASNESPSNIAIATGSWSKPTLLWYGT